MPSIFFREDNRKVSIFRAIASCDTTVTVCRVIAICKISHFVVLGRCPALVLIIASTATFCSCTSNKSTHLFGFDYY